MAEFLARDVTEAVHWTGKNLEDVKAFLGDAYRDHERDVLAMKDVWVQRLGRSESLLKPTGEKEWLGVAYEVPPTWYEVEVGMWVVRDLSEPSGFKRMTDEEFASLYRPVR